MLFNSYQFLIFLPVVLTVYFLFPPSSRWRFLLAASLFFYMAWKPVFVLLMLLTCLLNYLSARLLDQTQTPFGRRFCLAAGMAGSLGILFVFKYYNFFRNSIVGMASIWGGTVSLPGADLILPLGISFYTFQAMSYTIDVYRRQIPAERSFPFFCLFVTFFPQLVAGPIERAGHLMNQLRANVSFDEKRAVDGFQLILWGLFKKVVVADRLAQFVQPVYASPSSYAGPSLALATFFFAFQIFCDFSAYSDIAIGTARAMGINLMENFRRPYHAHSVSEFWSRWHISLSTWFRDYLYIPLGGNRVSPGRWKANIFITFLVSGLWHGANWTFILWGALHGFYVVAGILTRNARQRFWAWTGLERFPVMSRYADIVATFLLVAFAWIFFRANNMHDAWYIVTHLGSGWGDALASLSDEKFVEAFIYLGQPGREFRLAILALAILEVGHAWQRRVRVRDTINRLPTPVRWAIYAVCVIGISNWGIVREIPFIYFQF